MSALVGLCYLDGRPVARSDVERMMATLAHRGPDGQGIWVQGPVGLGHRMLRTTPESLQEALPRSNETGELVLTADARIDNRDELLAALGWDRGGPAPVSDSEIVLGAYEKWGERCPEHLLGDFAFAIWDGRRRRIFCARDHGGVKPFFYHLSPRVFAFASEMKALLSLPEVPRRLNETKVADYLVLMLEDKVGTFYRDIVRLPPAHAMSVGAEPGEGGVRDVAREYWSLDPGRELRYASDAEYAEAFREVFTEAVRCRLRSAYPVGSMLSGGLDTSSVVCVAREILARERERKLHSFSVVFDEAPESDESPYFRAVVAQGGLEAHFLPRTSVNPSRDQEKLLWHQDEPFNAPFGFLYWTLYRASAESGVRVLLDGTDGDSTVYNGRAYLAELACKGAWVTLAREVTGLGRTLEVPAWRIFLAHAVYPFLPARARQLWRAVRGRPGPPWAARSVINPEFARRLGVDKRVAALAGWRYYPGRRVRESHYRWITSGELPLVLEIQNRAAAAFGVEPRHPCHDKRLAEFCLALPPDQGLKGGWTRAVMRRAMGPLLPREVRDRGGKAPLSPSYYGSLLTFPGGAAGGSLPLDEEVLRPYVSLEAVRREYRHYVEHGDGYGACQVWWAMSLADWLRRAQLAG